MKTEIPKWMKGLWAKQCGQNWRDRTERGSGNRAARRAIRTEMGREHIRFADEDIYTDRPEILARGVKLLLVDEYPERREKILSRRD